MSNDARAATIVGMPGSVQSIERAAAILRLRDREYAGRVAERARRSVEERFSITAMVAGTIGAYQRALAC